MSQLPVIQITNDHLPTSRKTLIAEKALARVYQRVFDDMLDHKAYPRDLGALKTQYNNFIYAETRKAIELVYKIGSDYAERVTGVATFFSGKDAQLVADITREAVNNFWNKVTIFAERDLRNIHKLEWNPNAEDLEPELDHDYAMAVNATSAATSMLAIATVAKIRQITDSMGKILVAAKRTPEDTQVDYTTWKWVWVATVDSKTCFVLPSGGPGCAYLADTEWDYDEYSSIPEPGSLSGTHPNCRCRVLLKKDGQIQMY